MHAHTCTCVCVCFFVRCILSTTLHLDSCSLSLSLFSRDLRARRSRSGRKIPFFVFLFTFFFFFFIALPRRQVALYCYHSPSYLCSSFLGDASSGKTRNLLSRQNTSFGLFLSFFLLRHLFLLSARSYRVRFVSEMLEFARESRYSLSFRGSFTRARAVSQARHFVVVASPGS